MYKLLEAERLTEVTGQDLIDFIDHMEMKLVKIGFDYKRAQKIAKREMHRILVERFSFTAGVTLKRRVH